MRAIVAGLLVIGCGSSKPAGPPVAAPPAAGPPSATAPSLEPGELRLYFGSDPASAVVLRKDGTFDPPSKSLQLRVFDDGGRIRLGSPEGRSTFLTLELDGTVTPENAGIRISSEGVASFKPGSLLDGAGPLSIDPSGRVVGSRSAEMVVEGASTPELRRRAIFVVLGVSVAALGAAMSQSSGP